MLNSSCLSLWEAEQCHCNAQLEVFQSKFVFVIISWPEHIGSLALVNCLPKGRSRKKTQMGLSWTGKIQAESTTKKSCRKKGNLPLSALLKPLLQWFALHIFKILLSYFSWGEEYICEISRPKIFHLQKLPRCFLRL